MILSLEKHIASGPTKVRKSKAATSTARTDREAEPRLLDLVRLRVLQILDCKNNIRGQTKHLKALGETDQRLRLLNDWRNQAIFDDHEEAALNLAEGLTYNPIDAVPDGVIHAAHLFFNEAETIRLTLAVLAVNDWFYLSDRRRRHLGQIKTNQTQL